MENKTYCNLGLFSSNCIASKLQNYCIHVNDEYVNITYVHIECNLQLHVIVRLVISLISLSITYNIDQNLQIQTCQIVRVITVKIK